MTPKTVEETKSVVVRFAGDSGDGMQVTGDRFTNATAFAGNDLRTLPDFPAEIRAPAGTLSGVSAFQIQFADDHVETPGDHPNVLVAMNPAALKANLHLLSKGGTIIANEDAFVDRNLDKAGYPSNPLTDGALEGYTVYGVPMTSMTLRAAEGADITKKEAERSKNMFALGLISWMYSRPTEVTLGWIDRKFANRPEIQKANLAAFRAGYNFGETTEIFHHAYRVAPARLEPGRYRNISGTTALAWGFVAAAVRSGLPLFYSSYPITPASDLLHELSRHKNFGVRTLQAEDEIAAANVALGAAFGGHLAVTGTSGPGLDLKAETIGLAVMLELPLVVVDVQRAGPSTGMPTKTEQADLLAAMYGRHGEAPLPVLAVNSPGDGFAVALEASRIAVKFRTPVIVLTDAFLVNSSAPWRLPDLDDLPTIEPRFATAPPEGEEFLPYARDDNLARPWALPGTPGMQHRIGGLEKQNLTGAISYDPANHQQMTELRAAKVERVADDVPELEVDSDEGADLLVLGWGSTYGAIRAAARRLRDDGLRIAVAHTRYLNPLPRNMGEVLRSYPKILVPEVNMGQLLKLIRAEFLVDAKGFNKVAGVPIFADELEEAIRKELAG